MEPDELLLPLINGSYYFNIQNREDVYRKLWDIEGLDGYEDEDRQFTVIQDVVTGNLYTVTVGEFLTYFIKMDPPTPDLFDN